MSTTTQAAQAADPEANPEADPESESVALPWHHVLESPSPEDHPELALAQFREEWQREVQTGSTRPPAPPPQPTQAPTEAKPPVASDPMAEENRIFQQAREFFLAGVRLERHGDLHDATHISDLPPELVINILKWVVTSQLDLRSLERFSASCRWFYLLARSEELWRLVCFRTWGPLVERPVALSWREHFLTQPRVRVSGCYIARSSYTRQGERGFQDNTSKNTRTWHLVRYCRFLRFFPGGRAAMVTSADPPQNVVKTLALTACPPQGTLIGQYKVVKNRVYGIIKPIKIEPVISQLRRNRRRGSVMPTDLTPDQEFHFVSNP
ncbi:hypothetical protein TCAL_01103 [Tigriopus californicus]|uniref:F-box domain-containing protein n=1 Tax=Tigriopus californicus TaxID=6832 RepID=A0A553P2J8_TIGCA|nr:hypothetical protein TCAL_01103 [Tigriopus californicus]